MYYDTLHKLMEDFRRQFLNIQVTVYDVQKLVYPLNIRLLLLQFRLQLGGARLALPLLCGIAFTELLELLVGEDAGRHLLKSLCQ